MRIKLLAMSALLAFSLVLQPAIAQEEEGAAASGTAKVKGLKFTTKQINVPALEPFERDVMVHGYRGVDDFFNIREANPNVQSGQWEFELGAAWGTFASGEGIDDEFTLTPSIKYGLGDTVNIELGLLPINIGDGKGLGGSSDYDDWSWFGFGDNEDAAKNGNGDLSLKLFWQLMGEQDIWPAIALWSEARFPTGYGSEKIDGTLHLNFTKTLYDSVRFHMGGFIMTANGAHGDRDREEFGNRRNFQCGVGAGLDFALTDMDLLLINYLNKSSEYDGNGTTHVYEAGWVHDFGGQQLMLGVDYADASGEHEGPRWTGKVQWAIAF